MCHGLEDRLLGSSPEEIELIADFVTNTINHSSISLTKTVLHRFKKEPTHPVPMTQRGWKAQSSSGSPPWARSSPLPFTPEANTTVDFTMSGPEPSYAQRVSTGRFHSTWALRMLCLINCWLTKIQASRKNWRAVNCTWKAINGQSFCTLTLSTIVTILGMASYGII